ncbi:MAG: endosialidase [Lachnospiraceae bacterium]|nr:endosialidase [Lachnospiraceae bacterium]
MEENIIRIEEDGGLSFGDYTLPEKTKVSDFEAFGDYYKIKTFYEITKLEKNDGFVYESVPGTNVTEFKAAMDGMEFTVSGAEPAQLTLGLIENEEYEVLIDGVNVGRMTTNISGKLSVSVELEKGKPVEVKIIRR